MSVSGMAVTVTLVFADEAHREVWLERQRIIATHSDLDHDHTTREAVRRFDYEKRKDNSNLLYIMMPVEKTSPP
jgi:hypothetical protein